MASLTEASIIARRIIRYGLYAVVLLLIGRYTFIVGKALYARLFPKPPPPPTCGFGELAAIPFPPKNTPKDFSFVLETPEGGLPTIPDQTKVYFMQPFSASLGDLNKANDKARTLGFNPIGKIIVENVPNVYVYEKTGSPSTLTMNIINGIFSINYDISSGPTLGTIDITPETAISLAKGALSSASSMPSDLTEGPVTHQLLRYVNGEFVSTNALVDASAIKVNIFRKSYDDFPSVTSEADQANVWFIYGANRLLIRGEYNYFPIEVGRFETYPLISAEEGFEKLKKGEAFIATPGEHEGGDSVTIRRVYLGYYDPRLYTEFFQPVIVFDEAKADGKSFVAYVPATKKCD